MKRITIAIAIAVAVVLLMLGLGEVFAKGKDGITGNGAPNGAHYNLNIIGMPKGKTAEMKNSNGHVIFVNIDGHSKIFLQEGDDYDVLDKNGTDKDGALFQLPNPDPDYDGLTEYSIWARALGKAKGSASITTTVASVSALRLCGHHGRRCGQSGIVSSVRRQARRICLGLRRQRPETRPVALL
ncbi:MAG: hypothetical protein ACYS7Y_27895 [Planctomycetota bacterium]